MRREIHHYTAEQIAEHGRDALDLLDTLGVPDDLRQVAFVNFYNSLSAKQILEEQVQFIPPQLDGRARL